MNNPLKNLPGGLTVLDLQEHISKEDTIGDSAVLKLASPVTQEEAEQISKAYTLLRGEPVLRWFGFDFDRIDLPGVGLLRNGDPPRWVGDPPEFTWETGVADALVTITAKEFRSANDQYEEQYGKQDEEQDEVAPSAYNVTVRAPGVDPDEEFTCPDWHEVQQRCRQLERNLDDSYMERHAGCEDPEGNTTGGACRYCQTG